ncbi:endonuclease/exonuclease/phosphatase family protein [Frigoriglobus tundricola]|uniref:Endonuclease/exonuclease/phosphatase domain-containing protein n=1 Tax=Frigoriglobus tundricola TaxID=2774151 RepID=A0A6M5YJC5_9BACT|nr:endonuclease/exonuclease/phosphatase family protein [Frigoriglobus tundricola]QJW93373.1 hypothetical protein FTUN_0879 [Frigoriglobus tundricola]
MPPWNPFEPPPPESAWRARVRRAVAIGGWAWLAAAIGVWAVLRFGDEWEPATVVMFGPLWLLVLPPVALLVLAAFVNRRALRTLVPALIFTAGPVTDLCVPWRPVVADAPAGLRLRVMTCNMHYSKVPSGPLDVLTDETGPDVVALQEWREGLESAALSERGWHTHRVPGLFLASRYPIRRFDHLGAQSTSERGSVGRYELDTPAGVVTVISLHLASPREGLGEAAKGHGELTAVAENSELRWVQSRRVAEAAARTVGPLVLVGDFNTPPHSAIFREVWDGYRSAFSDAGWGWGYTFWARISAVRIDHILLGGGGQATRCWIGPNIGSPHRPVLADVAWPAGGSR